MVEYIGRVEDEVKKIDTAKIADYPIFFTQIQEMKLLSGAAARSANVDGFVNAQIKNYKSMFIKEQEKSAAVAGGDAPLSETTPVEKKKSNPFKFITSWTKKKRSKDTNGSVEAAEAEVTTSVVAPIAVEVPTTNTVDASRAALPPEQLSSSEERTTSSDEESVDNTSDEDNEFDDKDLSINDFVADVDAELEKMQAFGDEDESNEEDSPAVVSASPSHSKLSPAELFEHSVLAFFATEEKFHKDMFAFCRALELFSSELPSKEAEKLLKLIECYRKLSKQPFADNIYDKATPLDDKLTALYGFYNKDKFKDEIHYDAIFEAASKMHELNKCLNELQMFFESPFFRGAIKFYNKETNSNFMSFMQVTSIPMQLISRYLMQLRDMAHYGRDSIEKGNLNLLVDGVAGVVGEFNKKLRNEPQIDNNLQKDVKDILGNLRGLSAHVDKKQKGGRGDHKATVAQLARINQAIVEVRAIEYVVTDEQKIENIKKLHEAINSLKKDIADQRAARTMPILSKVIPVTFLSWGARAANTLKAAFSSETLPPNAVLDGKISDIVGLLPEIPVGAKTSAPVKPSDKTLSTEEIKEMSDIALKAEVDKKIPKEVAVSSHYAELQEEINQADLKGSLSTSASSASSVPPPTSAPEPPSDLADMERDEKNLTALKATLELDIEKQAGRLFQMANAAKAEFAAAIRAEAETEIAAPRLEGAKTEFSKAELTSHFMHLNAVNDYIYDQDTELTSKLNDLSQADKVDRVELLSLQDKLFNDVGLKLKNYAGSFAQLTEKADFKVQVGALESLSRDLVSLNNNAKVVKVDFIKAEKFIDAEKVIDVKDLLAAIKDFDDVDSEDELSPSSTPTSSAPSSPRGVPFALPSPSTAVYAFFNTASKITDSVTSMLKPNPVELKAPDPVPAVTPAAEDARFSAILTEAHITVAMMRVKNTSFAQMTVLGERNRNRLEQANVLAGVGAHVAPRR